MAVRFGAVAATLVAATSVGIAWSATATSLPTGVSVTPRVATMGATVTVNGYGCYSSVDVTETAFMFPGHPKSVDQQTVVPDSGGVWASTFFMPSAPAYVIATCDGVSSNPIVVAPTDVFVGNMNYAALTPTEIEITTSPLVNGSEFAIFDTSGSMLGAAIASAGTATVRLPRSLGPAEVIAVGLRQPDSGIPELPYVPIARRVQLPLPSAPSVEIDPRVTAIGNMLTASGNCSGVARLVVTAGAAGWYDIPPVYLDENLVTDASGNFLTWFPMPPTPSTVAMYCTQGQVSESAVTLISPSDHVIALTGQPDGSGVIVTLPNAISLDRLAAFTATGRPVPLAVLDSNSARVRLEPSAVPVRIVIVGIESLGENAQARQNSRVQGWSVDVGSLADSASSTGLQPADRISLPSAASPSQF